MAPLSRPATHGRALRSPSGRLSAARVRPALAAGSAAVAMIGLCAATATNGPVVAAAQQQTETLTASLETPFPLRLGDERTSRDAGRTDLTLEADASAAATRQEIENQQMREQAAAKVSAAASAVVPSRPSGGTPAQNRELGRYLTLQYGWDARQWSCVDEIFSQESGWSVTADNPSSSAYGIPQALPGSKMASVGADWETNPETQILWGLGYIDERYGTPCAAWNFKQGTGWY